jgi:hypothetical protein
MRPARWHPQAPDGSGAASHFCLERALKAGHCASLGITHIIDDRSHVLEHVDGVVAHRFLFGPQQKLQCREAL